MNLSNYKTLFLQLIKAFMMSFLLFAMGCSGSDDNITEDSIEQDARPNGFKGLLNVETLSSTQLSLTWDLSTNDEIVSYNIYDVRLPSQPVLLKTVSKDTTSTTISSLNEGFLYEYRVRAVDEKEKEDGNTVDLFGIPHGGIQNAVVTSSTTADIFFGSVAQSEALEGIVYCQVGDDEVWNSFATVTDISLSSVSISGLTQNSVYTCRYSISVNGQEDNNSERVTFTALGKASRISFIESDGGFQPGNGASGEPLSVQPTVVILDENNNIVAGGPDATALITLTIALDSPSGGAVSGTVSVNAVQGVAIFTDLVISESGQKKLTATKEDTSSITFGTPQMLTDSDLFNITSGNVSPALSTITINPAGSTALTADGVQSYEVIFALKDSFGNPISGIIPQFSSNVIGDSLSQPTLPTNEFGQTTGAISTTVSDTNTNVTRIINISSPAGLEGLTVETPFAPGAANQLAFSIQPQNSSAGAGGLNSNISVSVQDSFGNLITEGSSSTAAISLTINNNVGGATLSGTTSVNAVGGTALFTDLGIDITANGYRLSAGSGALLPATSNSFNIGSGIPRVIAMTGPADVLSGACSAAIEVQLQDFGGNPAKATQTTSITLSNFGNAEFYSNTSCSGNALSNTVQFTPGTDTRIIYLTSDKVESLSIDATDTSNVLTPDTHDIFVTPSKIRLIAEAAPPESPGQTLVVPSNSCSSAIYIEPLAEDNSIGQVFTPTSVSVSGLVGSQAELYSDPLCLSFLDSNDIPLDISSPPNQNTAIYLKGPASENLNLNVLDLSGNIQTTSLLQVVKIVGSEINLTGPETAVSGQCSDPFTLILEDSLGNPSFETTDITLTINGLDAYPTGEFFVNDPSCSGVGSGDSVLIPSGNSTVSLRFKGIDSSNLSIFLSDARGVLNNSQTLSLDVTPSNLVLVAPTGLGGSSDSNECVGPFTVRTKDSAGTDSNVLEDTLINLSGKGVAGSFYSDATCETEINEVTVSVGTSSKDFWFNGYYPEASLTLRADDDAGVLQTGTVNWSVNASLGFIGTVSNFGPNPVALAPIATGERYIQANIDGFRNARHMAFDPTYKYLYVVDGSRNRVLKYDYENHEYVGWIGRVSRQQPSGSNVSTPSSALCVNTPRFGVLPGWCVGGNSISNLQEDGGFFNPRSITVDDTYLYVTNVTFSTVGRYVAETGEFAGYIGRINSLANIYDANDDGNPNNDLCPTASVDDATPVWCMDGDVKEGSQTGDGSLHSARGIAHDDTYLYVSDESSVARYNKSSGAFAGWIGQVNNSSPTSNAPGTTGDCTATPNSTLTPGWCFGGNHHRGDPRDTGFMHFSEDIFVTATDLYTLSNSFGSTINRYDKLTGAFIETLPNHNRNWPFTEGQMDWDPVANRFIIANNSRIVRMDSTGLIDGWLGKVSNGSGMSGPGCSGLNPNENNPGWCVGGIHKPGLDEGAFGRNYGIAYDGNGSFLTSSFVVPRIQKFDASTGAYQGSFGVRDASPTRWISNFSTLAQGPGLSGKAANLPAGVLVEGDFLFVADSEAARIKKLDKRTGELIGMVGGMTTAPTGGQDGSGCDTANAMSPAPGWCSGQLPYHNDFWNTATMIDDLVQGIMHTPTSLASDGTWLYVADIFLHNIHRFKVDDGSYGGWLGEVRTSPTSGPGSNCIGAAEGEFTGGWCFGGRARENTDNDGNGGLRHPTGITFANGNIYVLNEESHTINSYNASTGQFNGWIGAIASAPLGGCTPVNNGNSYSVSGSGWCIGGSSQEGSSSADRGGAFSFNYWPEIHTDGVNLFVSNTNNSRVDKFSFDGSFIEAANIRRTIYTNNWVSNANDVAGIGGGSNCGDVVSLWSDSTYIYGLSYRDCAQGDWPLVLWRMDKTAGRINGWKGGIHTVGPTGGEAGCLGATGFTPAWCQGGTTISTDQLGGFSEGAIGMITGDDHFIYVTDRAGNRVMRIPK